MQIKNTYTFCQKIQLFSWLIKTKLICRKARLIRFPIDLRGKKYIDFGQKLTTGTRCRIEAFSQDGSKVIKFGNNVQINDAVHISAIKSVEIKDNVLMAGNIYISDNSHGYYKGDNNDSDPNIPPIERSYNCSPVLIEDNVWIGESVTVLKGVTIGKGSIIGANSVVSKNIPPYSIAVGIPAKVIKTYNFNTNRWEREIK